MPLPHKDPAKRRAYQRLHRQRNLTKVRAYMRQYMKKWRVANPNRIAYERDWARANRRKLRGAQFGKRKRQKTDAEKLATLHAKKKRYWLKHRERIRAKHRAKRRQNPDHFRALDRARYWRDPEKRRHQSRVMRTKRGGQSCYLTLAEWKALLRRFKFRCAYCKAKLTKTNRSLDHKIPLVRGGTNEISNLVPSCLRCNQQKHTQTAGEFQKYPLIPNLLRSEERRVGKECRL